MTFAQAFEDAASQIIDAMEQTITELEQIARGFDDLA